MKLCYKILALVAVILSGFNVQAQSIIDTVCVDTKGVVYKVKSTPGSTYEWKMDQAGGQIVTSTNSDSIIVDWFSTPGAYKISVVEKNLQGCWGDTVTGFVIVGPEMDLTIKGFNQVCVGEPVLLQAQGAQSYLWSTGEIAPGIVVYPKKSATYTVIGQGTCSSDTASFFVEVVKRPDAQFAVTTDTPKYNVPFQVIYKGDDKDVEVYVSQNENIISTPEGYRFNQHGQQMLTVVATNKLGCKDSITYAVYVNFDAKIYMPNAFTPDANNLNDKFKPVMDGIKSLHMEIYNRWGQKMYESDELDGGWDATYKGEPVIEGQYFYTIKARSIDNRWHYLDGVVNILY